MADPHDLGWRHETEIRRRAVQQDGRTRIEIPRAAIDEFIPLGETFVGRRVIWHGSTWEIEKFLDEQKWFLCRLVRDDLGTIEEAAGH